MTTFSAIIIDDEPKVCVDIREVLKRTRLFFVEKKFYPSVEQAIEELKHRPVKVDFAFLDVELEGMLGTEGVRKLRPYVRFIILCSDYRKKYAEEGYEVYPDGFFSKPLLESDIVEMLRELQQRESWRPKDPVSVFVRQQNRCDVPEESTPRVRDMVLVPLDQIVRVKRKKKEDRREGNEIDLYGIDREGHYFLLGSMRKSLKAFYEDYARLNTFVFVTASVIYHRDFILTFSLEKVKLKNNMVVEVARSRRSYLAKFLSHFNPVAQ